MYISKTTRYEIGWCYQITESNTWMALNACHSMYLFFNNCTSNSPGSNNPNKFLTAPYKNINYIVRTDEGQPRPKYIFNNSINVELTSTFYSTEV